VEYVISRIESGAKICDVASELGIETSILSRRLKRANYKKPTKGTNYRRQKFANGNYDSCEICGWHLFPTLLKVHHKDGNRQNSNDSNLAVLCPICHDLCHLTDTGVNHSAVPLTLAHVTEILALATSRS
jgi:hypothetical protein